MRNRFTLAPALALSLLVASCAIQAHAGTRSVFQSAEAFVSAVERHADELRVDDATLDAMRRVLSDGRGESERLRRVIEAERERLAALLDADVVDADAVRAQLRVIAEAELAFATQRAEVLRAVRSMLTPEQIRELRELVAGEAPPTRERPVVPPTVDWRARR